MTTTEREQAQKLIDQYFTDNPNVHALVCEFNGEGDEGSVDAPMPMRMLADRQSYANPHCHWRDWLEETGVYAGLGGALNQATEEIALTALEHQGQDWYNNDGGFGHVIITRDGRVLCHTETRYTETDLTVDEYRLDQLPGDPATRVEYALPLQPNAPVSSQP